MLSLDASPIPFPNLAKQSPLDIISSSSTDFTTETRTLSNQSNLIKNATTSSQADDINKSFKSKIIFDQTSTTKILVNEKTENKITSKSVNQKFSRSFVDSTPLSPISVICNLYDSAQTNFLIREDTQRNKNSKKSQIPESSFIFRRNNKSSISEENIIYKSKHASNLNLTSPISKRSENSALTSDTNFTPMKIISSTDSNSIKNYFDGLRSSNNSNSETISIQENDKGKISDKIKKYFSLRNIPISRPKNLCDLYMEPESPKKSNLTYSAGSDSPLQRQASYRQKIINELIETENAYIEFLKLMSVNLIEILDTAKTTIKSLNSNLIFNSNIELLITEHRKFLYEIQKLTNFSSYSSYSYYCVSTASIIPKVIDKMESPPKMFNEDNKTEIESNGNLSANNGSKVIYSSLTTAGAALVCKLVAEKAINTYFYEEYFSTFSVISHLLLKLNSLDSSVSKGIEKLLKSVQILDSNLDLSLNSLLQKPVSRLGKYRIICETLLKFMPSNDKHTLEIQTHLDTIRRKLNNINAFSRDEILQYDASKKNIFDRLIILPKSLNPKIQNYNCDNMAVNSFYDQEIPLESLGIPILCGSSGVVWIEQNKYFCHSIYGVLLFKSNIIICQIENDQRYVIKFMIPLGCCKIIETEATEGLYCTFKDSFKILFEYQFSTFELLLVGLSKNEIGIWKEKLALLTDFVNGPYEFDYSISESYDFLTYILPNNIEPVDTSLNNCFSKEYDFLNNCYFGELLSFQIQYVKDQSTNGLSRTSSNSNFKKWSTSDKVNENNNRFISVTKERKKTSFKKNISSVTSSPALKFEERFSRNVHFNMKDVYSPDLPNMCVDKLDKFDQDSQEHYANGNIMSFNTKKFKQQLVFLKNETRKISNTIISRKTKWKEDEKENEKSICHHSKTVEESSGRITRNVSNESITSISYVPDILGSDIKSTKRSRFRHCSRHLKYRLR